MKLRQFDGLGVLMLGITVFMLVAITLAWGIRPPPVAQDIDAQTSMAWAAWAVVVVSFVGGIVGAISLFLIVATLREAKRSADAAELSASHARESVEVTRRMMTAQTRAYMIATDASFKVHPHDPPMLRLTVTNSGATPASVISVRAHFTFTRKYLDEWHITYQIDDKAFLAQIAAGKDDEIEFTLADFERYDEIHGELGNDAARLNVGGSISYRTVFGWSDPNEFRFTVRTWKAEWDIYQRLARVPEQTSPRDPTDLY